MKKESNIDKPSKENRDTEQWNRWSQPRTMYTAENPPPKVKLICTDPSRTDQSQAAETDVNQILKKFQQTGVLPGVNAEALYADVSDSMSYHEAMNVVLHAEEQFNSLDAHTRVKFNNDPAQFLDFVNDPKNSKELIKMGLATETPPSDADRIVEAVKASKTPSPASPASGKKHEPKHSDDY